MTVATVALQPGTRLRALEALGEVLLGWGALSSLLYAGADVLAAVRYEGYGYASQAIGELAAVGAPTRALAVSLALAYAVLVIGFGMAVGESARGKRAVRITGALVVAYGLVRLAAPFFPMHVRGAPPSLTGAIHVALGGAAFVLAVLQVAVGSRAAGRTFRIFSLATLAVVVLFGAPAGLGMAAGAATPWLGIAERVGAGAYLLWIGVLDFVLLGAETRADSAPAAAEAVARIRA